MYETHRDIIRAWPSLKDFAADIGAKVNTAKKMRTRASIPWYYWAHVIKGAKERRIRGVSHDVLERLSPVKQERVGGTAGVSQAA